MTATLSLIKTELGRGTTDFTISADLLTHDDLPLVKTGILKFNGKYRKHLLCPECGASGEVTVHKKDKSTSYTFFCPSCDVPEDKEISPSEVELLDFNYRRFLLYVNDKTINNNYADEVAKCLPSKRLDHTDSASESRKSQLQIALESLMTIVEDACANSKDGAFLFTRKDYVSIVNELWNNHTSDEYAVSQPDAPAIASLWREIRLKLIEYAKSMIPNPSSLIRDLSNENCWLLFTKFTTVGEKPHVLDAGTVKELFATLSIQEKPRKTIKPKRAQTPKTQKAKETTVDIEGLPVDYRFAVAKDYEIVVDCLHQKPDYECINPYIGLPPTARGIIKKLITSARKKKAEGWCKSEPNWRGAFQKDVAWRFKNQQIEVEKRGGGLYYWRIIPNELFNEHYICKLKPRTPSF